MVSEEFGGGVFTFTFTFIFICHGVFRLSVASSFC
jgi:hypothetical protein